MGKRAVILFNLGGPDKLENVEPFLFNLFNDPAILNLPSFLRFPLAKLISNRRAPTAKIIEIPNGSIRILGISGRSSLTHTYPWVDRIVESNLFVK